MVYAYRAGSLQGRDDAVTLSIEAARRARSLLVMQSIIGGLVAEGVKESPEDMATRNAAPSHWQTGHLALVDDAFVVGVVFADQPEQAGLASLQRLAPSCRQPEVKVSSDPADDSAKAIYAGKIARLAWVSNLQIFMKK